MKRKLILISIVSVTLFYSCGSKKSAINTEELTKQVKSYVKEIDNDTHLKKETTEGALTDAEGFKDIGTFKFTVFFEDNSKELFKIENMEKTDKTIHETYYFEKGKFVMISVKGGKTDDSKIYNVGGAVSDSNDFKFYKDKAERFHKSFKQGH